MEKLNKIHQTPEQIYAASQAADIHGLRKEASVHAANTQKTLEEIRDKEVPEFPDEIATYTEIVGKRNEIATAFFSMLRGDKGDQGEVGPVGPQGIQGESGPKGDPGESIVGPMGPKGPKGLDGKNGKDGVGIQGPKGKDGVDGSPDTPDEVVEKVNKSEKKILSKQVIGLDSLRQEVDKIGMTPRGGGGARKLKELPDVNITNPTDNQSLTYDAATGKWVNETVSGGSGSPGGSDTQVQFNDGGAFGGDAGLTYDKTTDTLTVGQVIDSGLTASTLLVANGSKQLTSSAVTATEAGYLSGVTSAIQTQIGTKVTGPASATDNAIARWDTTTGKLVQDSVVTIQDDGTMLIPNNISLTFGGGTGNTNSFKSGTDGTFLFDVGSGNSVKIKGGDSVGAKTFGYTDTSFNYVWKTDTTGKTTQGGALLPSSNDLAAIGISGTAWADLFLASGGVINWNAGNMTLTHAAGSLTVSNGNFGIGGTTPGVRFYITKTTTVDTFVENMIQMQSGPSGNQDAFTVDNLGNLNLNGGGQANGGFTTTNAKVNADSTVDIFTATLARGGGNGGVGLGLGYLFRLEGGGGTNVDAGRFKYVWSTATAGSETATFTIQNKSAGSLVDALVLVGPNATFQGTLSIGTSNALTAGTIELGAASDTTLSRSAAGTIAVEGVRVQTTSPLVVSAASYTTDTGTSLNMDNLDMFVITAQAGDLLFNSPGGTLAQGRKLMIRIKDNGTARALTWNAVFRAIGTALPSTTVLSKTLYLGFIYNSTDTKWDLIASAQEA